MNIARLSVRALAGASLTALALAASPVLAQTAEAPAPDATAPTGEPIPGTDSTEATEGDTGEIVVTASRVNRSGYSAPTPMTSVGIDDIQNRAATNIADVLNAVPSFGQGTTPSSTNHTSVNSGANLVNLRNLGATRTLVLVDGRRFVPSTVQGRVDLNVIPTVLIERTEVVTGGASAAWGSDAMAGVVNLIFKKHMTGIQGEAQFGLSDYGDNKKYRAALSAGFDFADGRGNVVVAGEYEDNKGIQPGSSRTQLRTDNWQVISNPGYALGNGQSQSFLVNNVNVSTATSGGIITSGPLRGTYFQPGGVAAPFTYGTLVGSQYMVGGTPIGAMNQTELGTIEVPLQRHNAYGRASFEVSDALTLFAEASYARSFTNFLLSIPYDLGTITIQRDNAFLPASVGAAMDANGVTSFSMGRINQDISFNRPVNINTTQRYMVGGEGKMFGDWRWSAYFQFGQNKYREDVYGNRINANWRNAIDSVLDGSGNAICRSSIANPGNGCVALNLFGEGSPSAAASDYVTGNSWQEATYKEKSGAIDFSGTAFNSWAGPVSVAIGAEWREDSVEQSVDSISAVSGYNIHNPKALAGDVNVKEVYGEVVFPLLRDSVIARQLDLNGAIRYTDYSSSGGVTSWKIGATWDVNSLIRFRATRSRDIRAAALGELYASSIVQSATIIDPLLGIQYATLAPQQGNSSLSPEIGDTWTAGVVLKPARNLTASVDYYNIKVTDSIGLPNTNDIVNGCYNDNIAAYCSLISRGAGGYAGSSDRISQILRTYVNLGEFRTSGIDVDITYTTNLNQLASWMEGNVGLRVLATYIDELYQVSNGVKDNLIGVVGTGRGGMPHWRVNASATYDRGPFGVFLEGRYTGGGVYDDNTDSRGVPLISAIDGGSPRIDSQFLVNALLKYAIVPGKSGNDVQLFANVKNLFNDIAVGNPLAYILPPTSNAGLYDIIGRQYAMGVRFKF